MEARMTRRIINATSIAVITAGTSYGDASAPLPNWQVANICTKESAPGQCVAFEGEALRTVSATRAFVADAVKRTCFAQPQAPIDRSRRLLVPCIDAEAFKARTAVKTCKASGMPVPPANSSSPKAAALPTQLPAIESPNAQ
jgi:hypothetical protein